MTQEREPVEAAADLALGQRLHQALLDHPGLDAQQLLNLARDLMGETDSLFPALKVLATQACFAELLRASSGPGARPHLDAVLAFARQTLAPAMVSRLECTLGAACGLAAAPTPAGAQTLPLPVVLQTPTAAPWQAESGTVVAGPAAGLAAEPGTVMATSLRPAGPPASVSQAPVAGRAEAWTSLLATLRTVVLAVVVLFGVYGVLRSPWLCESFDLCSTEETPSGSDKPASKTPPPTTLRPEPEQPRPQLNPAKPVVATPAAAPAQASQPRRRPSRPAVQSAQSSAPADDPLWP